MARMIGLTMMVVLGLGLAMAQDQSIVNPLATAKFISVPVLPACTTFAVERGDPMKGPGQIVIKAKSGCVVPWHWHTASEELMFVSGSAKVEMKDGKPAMAKAGDYIFLPGKHVHQFTCVASCTFFNAVAGAFDIHYVDKDGKEVPPESVLKKEAGKAAPKEGKPHM